MASRATRRAKAKQGETASESIEKRHQLHPVTYILVIIVTVFSVIAFILLPMNRQGAGSGSIVFGTWDGHDIAYYSGSYFSRVQQSYARQAQESNTTADANNIAYSVWYQAFQMTALHVAELTTAQNAGVEISKDGLDEDLLTYSGYLDDNGKFSETLYNETSLSDRAATRTQRTEELITTRYETDVLSGVQTGSKEKAFFAAMAATERKFSFVSWKFSTFPDSEVLRYAEANATKFRKAKLSRITVATEREATQIRAQLSESTTSFAELAKSRSTDSYASSGGDMGWQYSYALETDLEDKTKVADILALKAGEVGEPLKGPFGWAVYRCDSEAVDADLSDTAVLSVVRTYLSTYEKGKIEDWFTERAGKFARRAAEAGFAAAAREAGVTVAETTYFPINLSSVFALSPVSAVPADAAPSSAAYSEDFFYRAFSLSKDQASSQPIVLDDQVLVLKWAGEQPISATNAAIMDRLLAYLANQSAQSDLYQELMGGTRFKNNFDEVYSRSVTGTKG